MHVYVDIEMLLYKVMYRTLNNSLLDTDAQRLLSAVADIDAWVLTMQNHITNKFTGDHSFYYAMSSKPYFRSILYPEYKAHRPPAPELLHLIKNAFESKYCTSIYKINGLEADDVLSIMSREHNYMPIIISGDKDMKQIPGIHSNLDVQEFVCVTSKESKITLARQILTGDSTDNVPGLHGIGDVKAMKIINEALKANMPLWPAILAAYALHGKSSKDAELTAHLVYLLQESPEERWTISMLSI